MNEHLEAKISAGQLALTMIVCRIPMLLFLPMLTGVYDPRTYVLASAASYLLSLPFMLAARHGGGRVSAAYGWIAGGYLLFCGAAGVAWLYSFLLSVADNPIPAALFGAAMVGTALYALYCGPEAIARISLLLFSLFLAGCALAAAGAAGRMSAANLAVPAAPSLRSVNLLTAVNLFAQPEPAVFLLLRGNLCDPERAGRGAADYCAWTYGLQGGFFLLLALIYGNAVYAREYPAALLFGNALSAVIFIAATAVRLYAFTAAATVGLKRRLRKPQATAAVFLTLAVLTAALLHERRAVPDTLLLMLGLGTAVWIITVILLAIGEKSDDKTGKISGRAAERADAGGAAERVRLDADCAAGHRRRRCD